MSGIGRASSAAYISAIGPAHREDSRTRCNGRLVTSTSLAAGAERCAPPAMTTARTPWPPSPARVAAIGRAQPGRSSQRFNDRLELANGPRLSPARRPWRAAVGHGGSGRSVLHRRRRDVDVTSRPLHRVRESSRCGRCRDVCALDALRCHSSAASMAPRLRRRGLAAVCDIVVAEASACLVYRGNWHCACHDQPIRPRQIGRSPRASSL